ncbi:MAG: hypothetical protein ACREM6_12130 [Vulcanimicrobiaceae bacterium]
MASVGGSAPSEGLGNPAQPAPAHGPGAANGLHLGANVAPPAGNPFGAGDVIGAAGQAPSSTVGPREGPPNAGFGGGDVIGALKQPPAQPVVDGHGNPHAAASAMIPAAGQSPSGDMIDAHVPASPQNAGGTFSVNPATVAPAYVWSGSSPGERVAGAPGNAVVHLSGVRQDRPVRAPSQTLPSAGNPSATHAVSARGQKTGEEASSVINPDSGTFISARPGVGVGAFQGVPDSDESAWTQLPSTAESGRGDTITGTARPAVEAGLAVLLREALSLQAPALPRGVGERIASRSLDAALKDILDGASVSRSAVMRSPEMLRALAALAQQPVAQLLALPQTAARGTLLQFAILLRAALDADGSSSSAAAIGQLRGFFAQRADDPVLALLTSSNPAPGLPLPVIGLPVLLGVTPPRSDEPAEVSETKGGRPRRPVDRHGALLPKYDWSGRRLEPAEQDRLGELAIDPRRGLAAEGIAAFEAERQEGLRLERAPGGEHDFVDEAGVPWNVVSPRDTFGLEATLRALGGRANLILSLAKLPAEERQAAGALARRLLSLPGARRLIAVGVET